MCIMKNKVFYKILSFILLLYPIFTVVNCIYSKNIYFNIININLTVIDRLLITSENIYTFWKIFFSVLIVVKIALFTILPIFSLINPNKKIFIFEFILLAVDFFFIIGLPNNFFIIFTNILFHIFTLFLIGKAIKNFE